MTNPKTLKDTITANLRYTMYNLYSDLYTYPISNSNEQTKKLDINPKPSAPLAPSTSTNILTGLLDGIGWFGSVPMPNSVTDIMPNPVSDGDFDTNTSNQAKSNQMQSEWTKISDKLSQSSQSSQTEPKPAAPGPIKLTTHANSFIIKKLHQKIPIDFVTNFMFAIEVDWPCDINLNKLFKSISLDILGMQIDKVESNQIPILQKIYGLDIKRYSNEKKIYFPIPIECLVNSNGLLLSRMYSESDCPDEVRVWFEFADHVRLSEIKSIKLCYNGITTSEPIRPRNSHSSHNNKLSISFVEIGYRPRMYQDNLTPMELSLVLDKSNSKLLFINSTDGTNKKSALTTRFVENFSTGPEIIKPGNPDQVTKFNSWHSRYVERFIIYFEDTKNFDILSEKLFDSVQFICDGQGIFTMGFDTIQLETRVSHPNLPDGVYVIEADRFGGCMGQETKFEFAGLVSDRNDLQVHIIPQTVNFLGYETTETNGYCPRTGNFFIN